MAKEFLSGIDVANNRILHVAPATAPTDAVPFGQLQDEAATKVTALGFASITVGTQAPANPVVNDLWVDTN